MALAGNQLSGNHTGAKPKFSDKSPPSQFSFGLSVNELTELTLSSGKIVPPPPSTHAITSSPSAEMKTSSSAMSGLPVPVPGEGHIVAHTQVSTMRDSGSTSSAAMTAALGDVTSNQTALMEQLVASHREEMTQLKATIEEERKQSAKLQAQFESKLTSKYNLMTDALNEKMNKVNEKKLRAAMDFVEQRYVNIHGLCLELWLFLYTGPDLGQV